MIIELERIAKDPHCGHCGKLTPFLYVVEGFSRHYCLECVEIMEEIADMAQNLQEDFGNIHDLDDIPF